MQSAPTRIAEPTYTKWFNPLEVRQRVVIPMEGHKRTITWEPGETKEVPSIYDGAINIVQNGVVVGGEARQLVNVSLPEDKRPKLHEAFDSRLIEQEEAAARAAAMALHQRSQENLALIAAARAAEADRVKAAADRAKK